MDVGFDLAASYGTIAVAYSNGSIVTERAEGDDAYLEVVARLSLDSSRHFAPPYNNIGEGLEDRPRKIRRQLRKLIGLPASADVGAISKVLKDLQTKAESRTGIQISSAIVAVPHLVALYQDDLKDAFEYVGLEYIKFPSYFRPVVWETAVAYTGYGFGLCVNYTDPDACAAEEHKMPEETVFAVHYARNALTTSLAIIKTAMGLWEPDYRHVEDFTLGYDARNKNPSEEYYWEAVRDKLRETMVKFQYYDRPAKVILTGDKVLDLTFLRILKEVLASLMDKIPEIYLSDPVFAAAKGAAEWMKRAPYS